MKIFILLSMFILDSSPLVFAQEEVKKNSSDIICEIRVPNCMANTIQNIITNRLAFLGYTELQSRVSAEQSEQKSILQWSGKNIKLKTLLPGESMIHNASISLVLENEKTSCSMLFPFFATNEIPELSFINQKPILILENDIKKIGYRTIKNKPGQVNLNITFSESGKRKMNELNDNYKKQSINYIIAILSSGYQHKYIYYFKCTESISFNVPYMDALLMLAYCKYPIPTHRCGPTFLLPQEFEAGEPSSESKKDSHPGHAGQP